jgi:hypothetical protein
MKAVSVFLFSVLFCALFPFSAVYATNYINNGTFASYNLNNGDTLRIQQGNFNGVISNLPYGAVIIVAQNATFAPTVLNLWSPAGKIINNGSATVGSMGIGGGFSLENNSIFTVNGDMSFYSGAAKALVNNAGARLIINGSLVVNDNTTIMNYGSLTSTGSISLYMASAVITNEGSILVAGSFNSQGQLINDNTIRIGGDFNYWAGQVSNAGLIEPNGNFSVSSGLTYVNTCRLITKGGVNNSGMFQNYGLLWAGTSGTANDQLTNSGSFYNASGAKVKMVNFTNYGAITGAGYFYATGTTTLGGGATIGVSGNTTDSIKVYDVSRSSTSRIFDNQWGTVYPNTKYAVFATPDSFELFAGCSNTFRTSLGTVALPVQWNYFYVKMQETQPVLYWSAPYEAAMKFDIERSYNGTDFNKIQTISSNAGAVYTFADATVGSHAAVYYRIKATSTSGEITYSSIQALRNIDRQISSSFSVYPNPSKGSLSIQYTSSNSGSVLIRVKSINGQQLLLKNATVVEGDNRIQLSETAGFFEGIYFVDLIQGSEIISSQKWIRQ